jgi:glyoxylase-like metal-dependent hydrolase (beta-lactamase superfamily II)
VQLEREGIERESISTVLLTHGHYDHLGGLLASYETLEPAFPNATVYMTRLEYDYWMAPEVEFGEAGFPEDNKQLLTTVAKAALGAVRSTICSRCHASRTSSMCHRHNDCAGGCAIEAV